MRVYGKCMKVLGEGKCARATTIKEATELLEAGFTYIQDIDGIKIYRKRK